MAREIGAFDRRRGAGEVLLDKVALQPDRVEDLRAAIGLVGRDAHLGDHLQDALAERLQVVLLHLLGRQRQAVFGADLLQGGEGEIRVDRLGAVAGQHAEMVHFARLAGLDDDAGIGALPLRGSGGGAPPRWRAGPGSDSARPTRRGPTGSGCCARPRPRRSPRRQMPVERRADAVGAFRHRPGDVERVGLEVAIDQPLDVADFREVGVGQDRLRDFQPVVRADLVATAGSAAARSSRSATSPIPRGSGRSAGW